MTWPYPGDGPIARRSRVAHAYRAALEEHAPHICAQIDAVMVRLGQTWAVPTVITHEPDEWLNAVDAANLACVELATLRQMRARGLLRGRKVDRAWEYRARDIIRLFSQPRRRNLGVTDTLGHSGRTVPGPEAS